MPSKVDSKPKYDFRTCLKKSDVLKPEVLADWLSGNPDSTPTEDASQLIKQKLLTEWQAKYLLSGRYRLHLGNYQLLKRIRRDSFGDCFIALHPQLGRTVQVQVLPVELTEDKDRRSEFLHKAGLAGELDHPNLAHVFDIDKQQGRYYLVTEHSDGKSLTELRSSPMSANTIARVVRDSIAGLKHAHERSVVHSNLSMDNVLINKDGTVKISQIALSPLAKKSSSMAPENVSPEQGDLLAIVRMGRRLLNDLPSSGTTRELTKVLSNLNTKDESAFANSLNELDNWIEQRPAEPSGDKTSAKHSRSTLSPTDSVSDGEIERLTKNAQLTDGQKTKSGDRKSENWEKFDGSSHVVRNVAIAVVVLVLGLIGHFGLQAIRQTAPSRPSSQDQTASRQTNGSRSLIGPNAAALLDSPLGLGTEALPDIEGQPQGKTPADSALPPSPDLPTPVVDPNAFQPKPEKKDRLRKENSPTKTVPVSTAPVDGVESASEPPAKAPVSKPQNSKPEAPAKKANPDSAAAPKRTKPQVNKNPKAANPKPAPQKTPKPFDGFPEFVDLPPTESVDEVVLAEIKQSSLHLLTMEIRSAEGIGKGKTSFELERNEKTKRQWTLLVKKTTRSEGEAVGEFDFDKASGKIAFHWLPKAAESRLANYARNCAVKVKQGSESRTMALRSPVALADLKMTSKEPSAKATAESEWLPSDELITVELLPLKERGAPRVFFDPPIGEVGEPLMIHFHKAASSQFMWIQVDSSIRNRRITLESKLMLKHADGTVQPIDRGADVKKLETLLREAAAAAQKEYTDNKDKVAPKGQRTAFKEFVGKLKSKATTTQRQADIAGENVTIVQSFIDRVLPVRVMLRAENYETVLVDSTR